MRKLQNTINTLKNEEILESFQRGIKPKEEFKIGIEYERLGVTNDNFQAAPYGTLDGICEFLRNFAQDDNWDYLMDEYEIIGLKKLHKTLTLEPGGQFELSLKPEKSIYRIADKIKSINKAMKPLLNEFNMTMINYGISPVSTYKTIDTIPKKRYQVMSKYLWGILSDVMMKETAGIQICIDFDSEEDAMKKFRISNMISPFINAMYANSPIRGGVDTGYKSFRSLSWLNTDNKRCGISGKFRKDFSFNNYIEEVLNVPMIMINRDNKMIPLNGSLNFKSFIEKGYLNYNANISDFNLHANLYFPDVRLRKYIEIRNHDCVNEDLIFSLIALYKGILYSKSSSDKVNSLLKEYTPQELYELRFNSPKYGLDTKIKKHGIKNVCLQLIEIAKEGLRELNEYEEKFLEPITELTIDKLTPADIILKNWYGCWDKNIYKLIKHVAN